MHLMPVILATNVDLKIENIPKEVRIAWLLAGYNALNLYESKRKTRKTNVKAWLCMKHLV